MRTILLITILASIISMKSFKKFIVEEQETKDNVRTLYHALVSAEHRGVVKDPSKFDPNLYIRTKYQPKGDISTAYGPAQITVSTAEDILNRYPNLFDEKTKEYTTKFIEQGKQMKVADPKDSKYGYGCKGDLCGPEFHEPYESMATTILKGKLTDSKIDYTKPLDEPTLTRGIRTWRGVGEFDTTNKKGKTIKGDPEYYKIVRSRYGQTEQLPAIPEQKPLPAENPMVATSTDGDYYTVQSGDTLWKIGGKNPEGVKKLQELNPDIDPNKIKPGQKIKTR